jgi:thioesterase DpgC
MHSESNPAAASGPSRPAFAGQLDDDALTLRHAVDTAEAQLRQWPERPQRDARQQALAQEVHQACRASRQAFLRRHAAEVYRLLVTGRAGHLPLSALAEAAAERFPGLVPPNARIAEERTRLQRDKEGLELDQAVFFAELLRHPGVGLDLITRLLQPTARALELLPTWRRERRLHLGKVALEAHDTAVHVTMHNPECLNAEDDELIDQMETAVDLALLDEPSRVVLLRGGAMSHPRYRGRRVFSAGIHLKELHRGRISYVDFLLRREFGTLNKMAHGLRLRDAGSSEPRSLQKPWVAAVDAFAIGGGAQILLVCDHVIASAESYFSLPAAQEGIVPGVANLRLPRVAGPRLARQVILSGRRLHASEPEAACVFDEVVEAERMDAAISARLAHLASPAVIPNRRMLDVGGESLEQFRLYMAQFALEQASRLYSSDVLEKVGRT